jgi:threonine/homoserine/homoserine lactone efflux protein
MILKGFRFGLLLQIAVGPICFFIFQAAASYGFRNAEIGVLGVTLVDALYIVAAIFGIGTLLNKTNQSKVIFKYFGAFVLILFGSSNIAAALNWNLIPSFQFGADMKDNHIFIKTLLLTLSNPLTIIFWSGVFSSKIAEGSKDNVQIYSFGLGAVLSTLLFLTLIAFLGSILKTFISAGISDILNIGVGILLIFFGVRSVLKE